MATLTPQEAARAMEEANRQAGVIFVEELEALGTDAVGLVRDVWPIDTGASALAWDSTRASSSTVAVTNSEPYASNVHDGLADQIIPPILAGLEDGLEERVDDRLRPIFEGER